MKVFALVPLLSLLSSVAAVVPLSSVTRTSSSNVVPGKYIIEVGKLSDIPGKRDAGAHLEIESPHENVYRSLKKRGVGFSVDTEYKQEGVFAGASVTLHNPDDISKLAETDGVVAVRPVILIPPPKPFSKHVVTGKDDPKLPPDTQSTHVLTGVDRLHKEGVFGKGIKIGIIDTGVDYNHPALGGGMGADKKVVGGYDFVGDAFDGTNTPHPDSDPLDECNGHGTHVAGIIGANPGNEFNISGVAYEATLSSYRVFGCTGSVPDDIIVDALLRAHADGQDIITLSIGGADGWTSSTSSTVASRIAASGRVVTIAAGNDGAFGSWYTSSPGNAIDAISVASLDNTMIPLQNATVGGVAHSPITYFQTLPFNISGALPVYATSTNTTVADDACNPLPESTPDLSKFVVVVRRGTCTFEQKLNNIATKGAKVAFIYDNGSGFAGISAGSFKQAALIQAADGEFLASQFAAHANITISFPQSGGLYNFPDASGGLISSFTSYGPTSDMYFKPAVAAPGGNILSTLPLKLGGYGVESGTSMATPFLAGSSALLLAVKGKGAEVATGARTLFQTTSQRVASSHTDADPYQTVSQQGAGLVNVYNAIHYKTAVSPGELLLNDTAHFSGEHEFTITNNDFYPKTYWLRHTPAGTAQTVKDGTIFPSDGPVPLTKQYAHVSLSDSFVLLLPGESQTITARISAPKNVDASSFPVYSGFIEIDSLHETLHVSYLGLAASLKDKQVLDTTDTFFNETLPTLLDGTGDAQKEVKNYTFVDKDVPSVLSRLVFATPLFKVDLVDPAVNISSSGLSSAVPTIGNLLEQTYIPRNSDSPDADKGGYNVFPLNATFANGTGIPDGAYRVLVRALRATGDRDTEADFESWVSPVFSKVSNAHANSTHSE